jgi:TrmH family RNA methyltransferase
LGRKKSRDAAHLFTVEGDKMIHELLQSAFEIRRLVVTKPLTWGGKQAAAEVINEATMKRLSHLTTPTSALAVVAQPVRAPYPAIGNSELALALDHIQDPGNLGTIIRTADWFGIRHVVCSPDTVDCYSPKVVQATMGAIFRVPVYYTALPDFLRQTAQFTPVYGAFLDGANVYRTPLTTGGVIVIGNESKGISAAVADTVRHRLLIPSFPGGSRASESLNAAVSAALRCAAFRNRL